MKLKDKQINVTILEIIKASTPYRFNCICTGTAFRNDFHGLVVGGEDGIIRIYDMDLPIQTKRPQITLETKGGPIQTMAIHDITKFYHNDLVVGDSQGVVTVFCNQQILCRHSQAKDSIRCLQIHRDHFENSSIVTSDESGNICAVLPSKELWRINLNNLSLNKGPFQKAVVTSLLSTELQSAGGERGSYILAADDAKRLHVLNQGSVVMTLNTPGVVTAMCSGVFVAADKLDLAPDMASGRDHTQVALGMNTGAIYILHNFSITEEEFASSKYHIVQMLAYSSPGRQVDYLLCCGHFNGLHVYCEGKKVGHLETSDWINSMDTVEPKRDRGPHVMVGCLDNTVLGLTLHDT